ncbi:Sua5/YciO/YrdC/YwlC family protein [Thiorhodococcus fuscus]|uniref:Threonylcarbamoyl-AMP synthase n=1 Tax=Thiorhodococcus fuscus TaxID=527200 RepID=A0ABW4Y8K3_9GAMM
MSVISSHRLRLAVQFLRSGGVIAYPTEAVFGLGCDPWDGEAVERLLTLKQRAVSKGLILIASHQDQLQPFVAPLPEERLREIWSSWPGPNTWLFPASAQTPAWLTGRFDTLAVRVTAHPIAAAICRAYGGPIVSTSANRARRRPARTALQVRMGLGNGPDYVLAGACSGADRPSRIRDGLSGRLLRV